MSDAWNPPVSGPVRTYRDDDDGGPGGRGLPGATVFGPFAVFRLGWAVLKEQPALVLLGALGMFAVQLAPSVISIPLQVATKALVETSDPVVRGAIDGMLSGVLGLLAVPLQLLVMAGLSIGTARWITDELSDVLVLVTSFAAAARMLLVSLIIAFVFLALVGVLVVPPAAGAVWLFANEGWLSGSLLLLVLVPVVVLLLWVQLGFTFAQIAAAIDGTGPFASIEASWQAARGARLMLLLTVLAYSLVTPLLCCLGGIPGVVGIGVYFAGLSAAWVLHTRDVARTADLPFVQRNHLSHLFEG